MKHSLKDKLMKTAILLLSIGILWLSTENVSLAYTIDSTAQKKGTLLLPNSKCFKPLPYNAAFNNQNEIVKPFAFENYQRINISDTAPPFF